MDQVWNIFVGCEITAQIVTSEVELESRKRAALGFFLARFLTSRELCTLLSAFIEHVPRRTSRLLIKA